MIVRKATFGIVARGGEEEGAYGRKAGGGFDILVEFWFLS